MILQIFPHTEKIENINDQYWTLRAEEARISLLFFFPTLFLILFNLNNLQSNSFFVGTTYILFLAFILLEFYSCTWKRFGQVCEFENIWQACLSMSFWSVLFLKQLIVATVLLSKLASLILYWFRFLIEFYLMPLILICSLSFLLFWVSDSRRREKPGSPWSLDSCIPLYEGDCAEPDGTNFEDLN